MRVVVMTVVLAATMSGCGSIDDGDILISAEATVLTVPDSSPPAAAEPPATVAAVPAGTTPVATPVATSTTIVLAAAADPVAQLQDDDETEQLPRTGPNETMFLIALGCAMVVGGRTLIDIVNWAARSMSKKPAPR